jgi:hypothetical protein
MGKETGGVELHGEIQLMLNAWKQQKEKHAAARRKVSMMASKSLMKERVKDG